MVASVTATSNSQFCARQGPRPHGSMTRATSKFWSHIVERPLEFYEELVDVRRCIVAMQGDANPSGVIHDVNVLFTQRAMQRLGLRMAESKNSRHRTQFARR